MSALAVTGVQEDELSGRYSKSKSRSLAAPPQVSSQRMNATRRLEAGTVNVFVSSMLEPCPAHSWRSSLSLSANWPYQEVIAPFPAALTHTIPLSEAHFTVFNGLGLMGEVPSASPWNDQPIEYAITCTPWSFIHSTALWVSAYVLGFEMYRSASGAMSISASATKAPWLSPNLLPSQLARSFVGLPTPV